MVYNIPKSILKKCKHCKHLEVREMCPPEPDRVLVGYDKPECQKCLAEDSENNSK